MANPTKLKRLFSKSYQLMLQQNQTAKSLATVDIADFTARFPWIDAAYLVAWQSALDAAEVAAGDEEVILNQAILTQDVDQEMAVARGKFQHLKVYAGFAFKNDNARQNAFGLRLYEPARTNQLKMIQLLELAHNQAENGSLKPDLLAKGYTQADIDALATCHDNLLAKDAMQEKAKVDRNLSTQGRVTLMNTAWNYWADVSRASHVVYATDAAKMDQYRLYPEKGGAQETTIIADFKDANSFDPITDGTFKVLNVEPQLQANTDENGIDMIESNAIPNPMDAEASAPGYETQQFFGQDILEGQENEIHIELVPEM